MIDKVIQKKWQGKYDLNSQIIEYSTSFCLLNDTLKIFATDNVFLELYYKLFTIDRSNKTHQFKFRVWLDSMELRSKIEFMFVLVQNIAFQIFIQNYNSGLFKSMITHLYLFQYKKCISDSVDDKSLDVCTQQINSFKENYNIAAKDSAELEDQYFKSLDYAASNLLISQYISINHLLFPIIYVMEKFFIHKTMRFLKKNIVDINLINELLLFICVIMWFSDVQYFSNKQIEEGKYLPNYAYNKNHRLIAN